MNKGFFIKKCRRKKTLTIIGIVLVFSLVSVSAYSANNSFVDLNDEIKLMESDVYNLQNTLNYTYIELNQTKNNLNQTIEKRDNLNDQLNISIVEKAKIQNMLNLTRIELFESLENNSIFRDRLNLTSPPTTIKKTDINRILILLYSRFNSSESQLFTLDDNYSLTTKDEMERFLSRNIEIHDQFEYVADIYDCDDSALRTYGELSVPGWSELAVGIAVFKINSNLTHMVLLFFDVNEKIWMIDYFRVKEIPSLWVLQYVLI